MNEVEATMRVGQRAHLVNENEGKVLRVCADSLPGDNVGALHGPICRAAGSEDLVS